MRLIYLEASTRGSIVEECGLHRFVVSTLILPGLLLVLVRRLLYTWGQVQQLFNELDRVLLSGLRVGLVLAHIWDNLRDDILRMSWSVKINRIDCTSIARHVIPLSFLGIARRAITDTVLYHCQCVHRQNSRRELSLTCRHETNMLIMLCNL